MALRPMLYASKVQPLLDAANEHDTSLVAPIVDWFRSALEKPTEEALAVAEASAQRLLSGSAAGGTESENDVNVVMALATLLDVQSRSSLIAKGYWGHTAWEEYAEQVKGHLAAQDAGLLEVLVQGGRPLFGSRIESGWAYYSYLLHDEAARLRAALDDAAQAHPEIDDPDFVDGFHRELVGWLGTVVERDTDLWLFAT